MSGFSRKVDGGVGYYIIDEFEKNLGVKTCFSTRNGGVSEGPFSTLNLGYKSGDVIINIDKNIAALCDAAGFNIENLVFSDQIHGDVCRIVGKSDRGKGVTRESDIEGVDALITSERDVAICIFTADCVPVFIVDDVKEVIALCHGGWRGIVNGIVPNTLNIMKDYYGCKPKNITAGVGPSIGPCCFYVGEEVVNEFRKAFTDTRDMIIYEDGRFRINLWNAVTEQLKIWGLKSNNILNSKLCSSCNNSEFFSYRRDGCKTGRMISILQLT